jgi:hypothetical protein
MTKRREPLTFHSALTRVAAQIGWDRCAAICGVTERAVRNWSDPDTESEIRMLDAERLDRAFLAAGGEVAPFHRVYSLRLEIAQREAAARDLTVTAALAAKEGGEAVSALIAAASPNATSEDRRTARREAEEAINALQDGLAVLDRQEAAGG